jgi:hypothetical protein
MGDSDNNNNEAPSRSSSSGVHRCHLSRGMERIARTEPLALDPSRDAPPLGIADRLGALGPTGTLLWSFGRMCGGFPSC